MNRIVSHYMINNPISIQESSSLNQVLELMEKEKLSHAIVTDENKSLSGIISKEDLLYKLKSIAENSSGKTYSSMEFSNIKAGDIMTKDVISVSKNDPAEYAIELLLQKQFHCLPVIEDNKAVGIVTFYDLLKGYYQEFG